MYLFAYKDKIGLNLFIAGDYLCLSLCRDIMIFCALLKYTAFSAVI